jgi:hypothetical protein
MVQRKASTENYIADDDGCGDIDSGTGGTYSVVSYRHGKENTHEEAVVAVCLPRIPDQGEPQRPRILRVIFRKQPRTRKLLLDRLGSEVSATIKVGRHDRKRKNSILNPSIWEESTSDMTRQVRKNKDSLRAAKQPPVMKPEIMAFHASSFCRIPFTAQSNVENMPPQTPKLPPVTGARAFIVEREPARRSPYMSWQVLASLA